MTSGPQGSSGLAVEYTGCDEVLRDGPVCEIGDGRELPFLHLRGHPPLHLRIHPPTDARRLELCLAGDGPIPLRPADQLLDLAVPPGTTWIELRARMPEGAAVWRLRLARRRLPAWLTPLPPPGPGGAARAAWARTLWQRLPQAPPELRGVMLHRLAGAYAGEARTTLFRRAMAAHLAAGHLLGEAVSGTALAACSIREHRFQAARRVLDQVAGDLPAAATTDAVAAMAIAYNRGVLARGVGDLRTALRELRGAAETAERLGFRASSPWWGAIGQEQALALQNLGRWPEAFAIFRRLAARPAALSGCEQGGLLLSNHAWSLLMQREAQPGAAGSGDPLPLQLLRRAEAVFDGERCGDEQRLDVRISLALAELQAGDATAARQALAEADRLGVGMTPDQRLWRCEIAARLARAGGRPDLALRLYGRLQQEAVGALSPNGRWLAAYGQARAYRELGNIEAALAAYREAAALIDQQSLDIPIFEGREMFVALREAGTRSFLDLLVRRGRVDEAFAVARHARSSVLRQLERSVRLAGLTPGERARWEAGLGEYRRRRDRLDLEVRMDWTLAADELAHARAARAAALAQMQAAIDSAFAVLGRGSEPPPPLRPGELALAYYDLGAGQWVGFAAGAGIEAGARVGETAANAGADATVARMITFSLEPGTPLPPAAELSRRLLAPFQAELRQARRVRVLPFGALRSVDFHALPFDGDILLAKVPVVYGLDLGAPPAAPPQAANPLRALVLADPRGDLPDARGEARDILRALRTRGTGWSAEMLPRDADAGVLSERLGGCDLFHYAGHAASGGAGGWESMLLLAHDTSLTLADLLALPRAPSWVVLAGCDTGSQTTASPVEVPSLAHAFLLAGARGVIAAVRPVDDLAARELFAELYRSWAGEPDLAARLRQAQLRLRAARSAAGWQSFRLFEP